MLSFGNAQQQCEAVFKEDFSTTDVRQFSTSAWFIGYLCLIYSLIYTKTKKEEATTHESEAMKMIAR